MTVPTTLGKKWRTGEVPVSPFFGGSTRSRVRLVWLVTVAVVIGVATRAFQLDSVRW